MDIDHLWLQTLQTVVHLAAHEVKDALNGVSLNLEVVRARAERGSTDLATFAAAASVQFEVLSARTEALLFLARRPKEPPLADPADVATALKHLAVLLIPAAKSEGVALTVAGYSQPAPTVAPPVAVRLALGSALLGLVQGRGGRCQLESAADPVVRFSHESAASSLDPAVAKAITAVNIRIQRSDRDLLLVFPGS